MNRRTRGFTLVEILIVVIILGILAAIVIPQFTNASNDARRSGLTSQLQTLRSQVELYKLQHAERWPTDNGLITGNWDWTKLTGKTDETGAAGGALGPYLQQAPLNPLISDTATNGVMGTNATDPALGTVFATAGFVFSQATGKVFALDGNHAVTAD